MQRQYVGIDLHRRTSTIYRMSEAGETLDCVRIASEPLALAEAVSAAGPDPEVVLSRPMAGTGRPMSSKTSALASIWRTPSATTGATGA
jgi:hypothetical protein